MVLEQGSGQGQEPVKSSETQGKPMQVVFVDNNKGLLKQYERMFPLVFGTSDSFESFENGQEAWDWFQENPGRADLLWTDNSMPEMRGSELIKNVRSQGHQIITILTTTDTEKYRDLTPEELAAQGITMVVDKLAGETFEAFENAKKRVIDLKKV